MSKRRKKKKVDRYAKITALYEDPSVAGSLGGVVRFAKAQKLPVAKVREKLEANLGYTLHKPTRRHFATLPVMVFGIDDQWVADLIEVGNIAKANRGYRYLLTVVDVFSKYAWVEPVKSKTGKAVTAAFEKILKHGRTPRRLQTDDGKEFYNKTFQALMKRQDIVHFSTSGDTKASVVERFNRTLKERLYRYFTVKNTLKYLPVFKDLVMGYNRSYHRSIKMAPDQVTVQNEEQVWKNLYAKRLKGKRTRPKLKVGDRVRLNKKYRIFKKGYLPGWTEEVFVVSQAMSGVVPTYKIQEWDGTSVEGTFYHQDLQKVTVKDDDLFRVEKIIKRKGDKVLVRWKGWPDKYDSWIEKRALTST